ncbi:MAG: hypothetical protein ACTFAK_10505 [Candidatus Electronema sp. VV]
MDILTGALLAGAAQLAVAETTKAVVKDAYEGLKAKVKQWFIERKRPEGEMALAMIEQKPDIWQGPLAEAVKDSGAADNEALLQAAQALLKMLEEVKPQTSVTQKVQGNNNIFSGTGNVTVTR